MFSNQRRDNSVQEQLERFRATIVIENHYIKIDFFCLICLLIFKEQNTKFFEGLIIFASLKQKSFKQTSLSSISNLGYAHI